MSNQESIILSKDDLDSLDELTDYLELELLNASAHNKKHTLGI